MSEFKDSRYYAVSGEDLNVLAAVRKRLYEHASIRINADEAQDMATGLDGRFGAEHVFLLQKGCLEDVVEEPGAERDDDDEED